MKVPSPRRKQNIHFDLTPLIDIVFLLIIFFLVSSHFVRTETGVEVNLPKLKMTNTESPLPNHLVITVTSLKQWFINKTEYQFDDIKDEILNQLKETSDLVIKIRCDEELNYGSVEPLIRFCRSQNVSEIQFAATTLK